jgi:hypothetical protein
VNVAGELIQKWLQHVIREMPFKLLHSSKMLSACRAAGLHDLVRAHERIQIVAQYFFPKSF